MPSVAAFFMVMLMIIYNNMEVMECLVYENEPETVDREIRALCSLNPTSNICAEYEIEKRKSRYMDSIVLEPEFESQPYLTGKRKSAYMRFGKRYADSNDYVKRKSAYMRSVLFPRKPEDNH